MDFDWKILQGDSLNLLNNFKDESFDMIFIDPPYFLSGGSFTCKSGKKISVKKGNWDIGDFGEASNFHNRWITECFRILKKDGCIWVTGTYHSIYTCGYLMIKRGFRILNEICWYKPNASPNLSCRRFTASHETLIWATKSKKSKYTFNYKYTKTSSFDGDLLKKKNKQMRSVWSIPTTPKSEKTFGHHPTQKPEKLLERIVLSTTLKNDYVLDPFMGSGTTGVIAIRHNRNFTGIEINPEYYELARNRLNAEILRKRINVLGEE